VTLPISHSRLPIGIFTGEHTQSAKDLKSSFGNRQLAMSKSAMDDGVQTFRVNDQDIGTRLDAFLVEHISDWSRSQLQRLIQDGDVLVNGAAAKPSYRVNLQDEIEIELGPSKAEFFSPEPIPLEVVYEDNQVAVINKPAGMVVHPAAGVDSGTVANALAYHFQQLSANSGSIRPGIVHRLDKDTSGLLVVAKTSIAHEHLAEQFRDRTVSKSYVALVHGAVKEKSGRIEQPIGRDPRKRTRMAIVRGGRYALSQYTIRRSYDRFTLLNLELKTGRTHQLRVHLAWFKHPVVGDPLYGGGRDNTIQDPTLRSEIRKLGRQFLHAEHLGFRHPETNLPMQFTAPLPAELQKVLGILEMSQLKQRT
jgi:23S rRNA pseudouridine1911/1915/1917 synthase